MAELSLWNAFAVPSLSPFHSQSSQREHHFPPRPSTSPRDFQLSAAKTGGFSFNPVAKKCQTCGGQGAIECPGCKGTGKNKKNGNIFERWKCFDCQGFGLKSCPVCGKGGLTPEQRGER